MKKTDIPYDGYGNVLEMLRRADAPFREKILKNLRLKDPSLAKRLEQSLTAQKTDDSRATLERSQRAAFTRNYGN